MGTAVSGSLAVLCGGWTVPLGEVTGKSTCGGTLEGNSIVPSGFRSIVVFEAAGRFVLTESGAMMYFKRVFEVRRTCGSVAMLS